MQGYKDSGIEWIGKIPIDWKIKKIKHLATEPNTLFIDGDWIESKDISESGIRYLTSGNVGEGEFKRQGEGYVSEETFEKLKCLSVYPGDLMISRLNLPIGRACIVPEDYSIYVVAVDNVILRPNKSYSKKYLMYIMNTNGYSNEAEIISRGTTMKRISRTLLGEMKVCTPSLEEQQKIADFLDKECKRIDRITEKIEKQIEILKEYQKSLITETVTRGLNKNVKMKDSGVDIIGYINDIYQIMRLRYICSIDTGNHDTQDGIDDGIYDFFVRSPIVERINEYDFEGEAILMAGDGVGAGKVFHHAIGKFGVHQRVYIVYNFKGIIPRFLYYFMSNFFGIEMEKGSAKSTVDSIRMPMLKNFSIVLPSLREQQQIADFLDKKCSEIDLILSKKAKQLDIIKEHKKSLIYEYVTGKKRVGGVENGD